MNAMLMSVINDHHTDSVRREVAPIRFTRANGETELLCIPVSCLCLTTPRPTCLNQMYKDATGQWHLSPRSVAYWQADSGRLAQLLAGEDVVIKGCLSDMTVTLFPEGSMLVVEALADACAAE